MVAITPIMGYDPMGTWDWGTFWKGAGMVLTAVGAVVAAVGVLSVAAIASPFMIGVAVVTLGAGILTGINGISTIVEAGTGYNVIRDGLFNEVLGLSDNAYNWYAGITQGIAIVGSLTCSVWQIANHGKIQAFKSGKEFLGEGYTKVGANRFVSKDGMRQMRLDIGKFSQGAPNHINLQSYMYTGLKGELLNAHVYFNWWKITRTAITGILA